MHRLLHDATKNSDLLFLVIDQQAKIHRCNPSVSELTGYCIDELIGQDWIGSLIPFEGQEAIRKQFVTGLEEKGLSWDVDSDLLCKDGSKRSVRWNNTLALDPTDDEVLILTIGIDITEIMASMQRSQSDYRRYKTLLDNLPQHIFHKDPDSIYLSCNQSFANGFGKSPDEIVGTNDYAYFTREQADSYREDDARIIKEGRQVELIEAYEEQGSETLKSVKTIKTPIYDDEGRSEGLIGIFWDITQEVEAKRQLEETKEILANAEHIAHVGSWKLDIALNRLVWSDELYAIFEVDQATFTVTYENFLEHVHPEDRDMVNQAYLTSLKTKGPYRIEHRLKMRDGHIKTVLEQWYTSFDEDGTPLISNGIIQDITELKAVDQEVTRQAALLRSVIDATPDLIFYKDYSEHDGIYTGCNQAFESLVDRRADEIIGHDDLSIFGDDVGRSIRAKDKEVLRSAQTHSDERWVDYPNGRHVLLQTLRTPLMGLDEKTIGVIGVSRDITSHWRSQQRISQQREALRHRAHHDELTGLPNRTLLYDRLRKAISKGNRNSEQFALLFIDLDHFKQINDSFGHAKGDAVLREVAMRLDGLIRDEDTLSRLGGDEFVILIEQLHDSQHASIMADKILQTLIEPIIDGPQKLYITTSIGISIYPQDGSDGEDLLKNADIAMYKAKELGRDNYQYYDVEMTRIASERVLMESDLRRAIKEDELVLFYQPKVDLDNDRIEGFEVLIRWQHPRHGLILPSKFLSVAEESGMIVQMGEYILEKAAKQLKSWQAYFGDIGHISLNVSTRELQQTNFFERFVAILKANECRPENIRLEITEDFITKDPTHHIPVLKKLIDYGLKIAIDDFGKGYTSLTLLKQLPIYRLKIDGTFIQGLPQDLAVTKAILAMAKSLGLDVIAKGVETELQSKTLKAEGCKVAQGFLYGRPANAHNTGELIRTRMYA